MAISFARMIIHSRTQGRNAVAGIAYRAGIALTCERTGETFDYSKRDDVAYSKLCLPNGAREAYTSRDVFWNAVERNEKRKDSQVAQDLQLALPKELSLENHIALTHAFVDTHFLSKGIAVDIAIHDHGDGNPHAHLYLPTRTLTHDGFSRLKAAHLINPKVVGRPGSRLVVNPDVQWHEHWRLAQNEFFEQHDLNFTVDANYGIAMKHEGRISGNGHYHKAQNHENLIVNRTLFCEQPDLAVGLLARQSTQHSIRSIKQLVMKLAPDAGAQMIVLERITQHPAVTVIGKQLSISYELALKRFEAAFESYCPDGTVTPETVKKESVESIKPTAPETLASGTLSTLTQAHSVFSERDIDRTLFHRINKEDDFQAAKTALLRRDDVHALGLGVDGKTRYTTTHQFRLEADALAACEAMRQAPPDKIRRRAITRALKIAEKSDKPLTDEQRGALHYITAGKRCTVVMGRAGTGKSSVLMKAANHVWQREGKTVLGVATAAVAATGLQAESGIESMTLKKLQLKLAHGFKLTDKHVVVLDEAGMVSLPDYASLIHAVNVAGAKLVSIGDSAQLQPIGAGAFFRGLASTLGFYELSDIKRQKKPGDNAASKQLAKGHVSAALKHYSAQGNIHFLERGTSIDACVSAWQQAQNGQPNSDTLMLAFTRKEVAALNDAARSLLKNNGKLQSTAVVDGRETAIGERWLLTENQSQLGIVNGTFATVTQMTKRNVTLKTDDGKTVTVPSNFTAWDYGYATTIHKAQGATAENVFVHVGSRGWHRHLTYVALTRHKQSVTVCVDKSAIPTQSVLNNVLGQRELRDNVLDYPMAFSARRGVESESTLQRFLKPLLKPFAPIRDKWHVIRDMESTLAQVNHESTIKQQALTNQMAANVAVFADLNRQSRALWKDIFNQDNPSHRLRQNAVALTAQKNQLAATLLPQKERLHDALLANRLSPDILDSAAMRANGLDAATLFVAAIKNNKASSTSALKILRESKHVKSDLRLAARRAQINRHTVMNAYRVACDKQRIAETPLPVRARHFANAHLQAESICRHHVRLAKQHHQPLFGESFQNAAMRRDKLAHQLLQHIDGSALPSCLNLERLQKQAARFSAKNYKPKSGTTIKANSGGIATPAPNWPQLAKAINTNISQRADTFYPHYLGKPSSQSGHTLRFGKKGSLSVSAAGAHAGCWYSFESGTGGSPIDFLMDNTHGQGLDFKAAVTRGAHWCGISLENEQFTHGAQELQSETKKEKDILTATKELASASDDDAKRQARVDKLVAGALPLAGTLAADYLKQHRGIDAPEKLDCSYHPAVYDSQTKTTYPAVLIKGLDENDNVHCVQTILLNPDTAGKANVDVVKRSHGSMKGAVGLVQSGSDDRVILAEGLETAASLATKYPESNVYCLFGNPSRLADCAWLAEKHDTDTLYIGVDNDGAQSMSEKALEKSAASLAEKGIRVRCAKPDNLPGKDKTDWNDVHLAAKETSGSMRVKWEPVDTPEVFDNLKKADNPFHGVSEKTLDAMKNSDSSDCAQLANYIEKLAESTSEKKTNLCQGGVDQIASKWLSDQKQYDNAVSSHPELKAPLDKWVEKQMKPLEPVAKALAQSEKNNTKLSSEAKACQQMIKKMKKQPLEKQHQQLPELVKKIERLNPTELKEIGIQSKVYDKFANSLSHLSRGRRR